MSKVRKHNVGNVGECYGCAMCAVTCPHKCISMKYNKLGFLVPYVSNEKACTSCGLCTKVCNYRKTEPSEFSIPIASYAGWSNNIGIRTLCSSGGVCYEIAKNLINKGFQICSVRYNPTESIAEHYIANTIDDLAESVGSKYIQSHTIRGFAEIKTNEKNVIIATPCQIDMWRRYLKLMKKEDNFLLVDFFCHGVPSLKMWKKYLAENSIKKDSIITWRDKRYGWHSSWNICAYEQIISADQDPYYISRSKDGDTFFFMFLSNCCLNTACYSSCKYKLYHSSADIRVGDLWGPLYSDNEKGVNGVMVFTQKGENILRQCDITLLECDREDVAVGQMKIAIRKPWYYKLCSYAIDTPIIRLNVIRRIFVFCEIITYQFDKLVKLCNAKKNA